MKHMIQTTIEKGCDIEMGKMHIGDLYIAIKNARAFKSIAMQCQETLDDFVNYMEPFFVNGAFACETLMKAIMINESSTNEFEEGHDLLKLFNDLPETIQNTIKNNYQKECCIGFEVFLNESKDAFVRWRYNYESGAQGHVEPLVAFMNILDDYISNNIEKSNKEGSSI